MDVLTSPCFLKQWQLKVVLSKWDMFDTMTAKNCMCSAHRHSWWRQSYILLLFPIQNLMGILILRGILKINKSISSKKPFAWVPNVCSEALQGNLTRNVYQMIDEKNGQDDKLSQNLCSKPPKRFHYNLHQITSNESSATLCLLGKIFSIIWSLLSCKLNCSVRQKNGCISV